jgi:hypothetical protein
MPRKKAPGYIRNLRYVPCGLRLGTGRRIDLQPRGQRGDLVPIKEEEREDEIFLGNEGLLFEVISATEAQKVLTKQTHNQQARHPALDAMRNEIGEPYESGVVVEESNEEQGRVVATVSDRGMIHRFKAPGTVDQPLPKIPDSVPPEEQADWVARNVRTPEGPEAGLAGIKVIKAEVQTTNQEK